ncbi:hypothetical protein [Halorussus caseinilyticus]|uniref:Molybdopterin cofactor biosynthesis MoaD-related C-terminal domain-containing protein n=1 Tax=Halorussus caseinilyticus TaxID=3034025 RepID=A0ABD5WTC3_9EURY|nr:hypothetical protein [Halorussus sp. DT72]
MRVEKSYRGISERLARRYLSNLGGTIEGDGDAEGDPETGGDVVADDWRASVSSEKVNIGPSVTLTEVTVVFEGEEATLDSLVADFSQKAMRAGG